MSLIPFVFHSLLLCGYRLNTNKEFEKDREEKKKKKIKRKGGKKESSGYHGDERGEIPERS